MRSTSRLLKPKIERKNCQGTSRAIRTYTLTVVPKIVPANARLPKRAPKFIMVLIEGITERLGWVLRDQSWAVERGVVGEEVAVACLAEKYVVRCVLDSWWIFK